MLDEISSKDVLEALTMFAERTDSKLGQIDQKMGQMDKRLGQIEASMVTKEYLDNKLADFYGQSLSTDKKVDKHVDAVVEVLVENKTISEDQKKKLMAMEPFPKLQP